MLDAVSKAPSPVKPAPRIAPWVFGVMHPALWVAAALLACLLLLTDMGYAPWHAQHWQQAAPVSAVAQPKQSVSGAVSVMPAAPAVIASSISSAVVAPSIDPALSAPAPSAFASSPIAAPPATSLCDTAQVSRIQFKPRSATLTADSVAVLNHLASCLALHMVRIEGHTDSVGTLERKTQVSLARAQAVKDYLVSRGVPERQLSVQGLADRVPLADNTTPQGRALNRRITLDVLKMP